MLCYRCRFVLYIVDLPGEVQITSINSTCNSVIIDWVVPRDENDILYDVRVKYSYTAKRLRHTFREKFSGEFPRRVVGNLPSDTLFKFSFRALTKREKKGPATYYTIRTNKPSEFMLCYTARVHYIIFV